MENLFFGPEGEVNWVAMDNSFDVEAMMETVVEGIGYGPRSIGFFFGMLFTFVYVVFFALYVCITGCCFMPEYYSGYGL